jgi:HAMP domain-containing protein
MVPIVIGIRYAVGTMKGRTRADGVYDRSTVRRTLVRAAALFVACVFASLPTLARIHERLAGRDAVSSFRLSKNIERPHQKAVAPSLDQVATPRVARDDSNRGHVVRPPHVASALALASTVDTRAPPTL